MMSSASSSRRRSPRSASDDSWQTSLLAPEWEGPDGVLLVDKPSGPTSHDIVAAVRRRLPRGRRVGHAGTLDPFATGLLIVLIGRATRTQRLFLGLPKRYETEARLGWRSSTGDRDGELEQTGRVPGDPPVLPTGEIRQRPPMFSAVKVDGQRAYKLARAGAEVEVPERTVTVTEFRQAWRAGDRAGFDIACGSGTYVRSLIAELGDAYCEELRRTAIGPFSVDEATPVPLRLADALARVVPVVKLDAASSRSLGHGQRPAAAPPDADDRVERLYVDPDGQPVALARPTDGHIVPTVGFRA